MQMFIQCRSAGLKFSGWKITYNCKKYLLKVFVPVHVLKFLSIFKVRKGRDGGTNGGVAWKHILYVK